MEEEAEPQAEEEIETQEPAEAETPPVDQGPAEEEKPPEGEKPPESTKPAEEPPEGAEERELTPSEQGDKDAEKSLDERVADMFWGVYNNKYYMDVLKATAIFIFALKIANELKKISIPLRDYQPFQFHRVCTCGKF